MNAGNAVAVGTNSDAKFNGVSIGNSATASLQQAITIGSSAATTGISAIAIGYASDATQTGAIAIGDIAQATGTVGSIAIGDGAAAAGASTIAIGIAANVQAADSVAIGPNAIIPTNSLDSVAIGRDALLSDGLQAATGLIREVSAANHVDGEQLVIDDGPGAAVTFEWDNNSSVVQTPTLRAVTYVGGETDAQMRNILLAAIQGSALNITATPHVNPAFITLVNNVGGIAGNILITTTVANATFVNSLQGMTGGFNASDPDTGVVIGAGAQILSASQSIAIGDNALIDRDAHWSVAIGSTVVVKGSDAIGIGEAAEATGDQSIAMGIVAIANGTNSIAMMISSTAQGTGSIALGDTSYAGTGTSSIAIGPFSDVADGVNYGISIGDSANVAAGATGSVSIGYSSQALGTEAVAIGDNAHANTIRTVAIGHDTVCASSDSTAVGNSADATNGNASAFGSGANSAGISSTALGAGSQATATDATVVGANAIASASASVSIGRNAAARGASNVVVGGTAKLEGGQATGRLNVIAASLFVVGADTDTFTLNDGVNPAVVFVFDDDSSVVQTAVLRAVPHTGTESATQVRDLIITAITNAPSLAITASIFGGTSVALINDARGAYNSNVINSVAIGVLARSTQEDSVVIGHDALNEASYSVVIGKDAVCGRGLQNSNVVVGPGAYASAGGEDHGWNTVVGGDAGIDDGYYFSTVLGYGAFVAADDGLAIGDSAWVKAGSTSSIAIGDGSTAEGLRCIAIGSSADVRGNDSICIGEGTQADVTAGTGNVIIGSDARQYADGTSESYNVIIGKSAWSDYSDSTVSIGQSCGVGNSAAADGSVAVGYAITIESGAGNVAIGQFVQVGTNAGAIGSIGIGGGGGFVSVDGNYSMAIGYESFVGSDDAIAIGGDAVGGSFAARGAAKVATASPGSIAIGSGSAIWNNTLNGIAIGQGAKLGTTVTGNSDYGIAIGHNATVANSVQDAVAIGRNSLTGHASSVAIGVAATTTAANQLMIGAAATALNTKQYGYVGLSELASPPAGADAGWGKIYVKSSDNNLYFLSSSGAETNLLAGGSSVIFQDEGSPVTGAPHTTVNFVGAGVTATNGGGGVVTVTIPGGGGGGGVAAYLSVTVTNTSIANATAYNMFADANYSGGVAFNNNLTAAGVTYTPANGRFTVAASSKYKVECTSYLNVGNITILTVSVNGSPIWTASPYVHSSTDPEERTISLVLDLAANDYVEFTVDGSAATQVVPGTTVNFTTIGVDGADGEAGAKGPQGVTASGSTINIQEEGTPLPNSPHTALNFIGASVTAADAGSGVASITITGAALVRVVPIHKFSTIMAVPHSVGWLVLLGMIQQMS
jgi:hypothetical protein